MNTFKIIGTNDGKFTFKELAEDGSTIKVGTEVFATEAEAQAFVDAMVNGEKPAPTEPDPTSPIADEVEKSDDAIYIMTNKETGEKIEVVPHTIGDGYVDMAPIGDFNGDTLYRFNNPDKSGILSSDEFDIELKPEEEVQA